MQNSKRTSYCSAVRSEMVFRHSYPGIYNNNNSFPLNEKQIQKLQDDVEKLKFNGRRLSNTSLSSNDSGIGFSKADYEIQRAIKAQRVQRPHIIVLHKGKPISHATINNMNNHDEFEANIVVAAATASKRNRREISVMQKRQTMIETETDNYDDEKNFKQFNYQKNNSAPNLYQATMKTMMIQKISKNENIKDKITINPLSVPKQKSLIRSVSGSIKRFIGVKKNKERRSHFVQQIHERPKFF